MHSCTPVREGLISGVEGRLTHAAARPPAPVTLALGSPILAAGLSQAQPGLAALSQAFLQ